ncbi:MAG: hypothetical protein FWC62_05405 [Firmicutes bacterium]|nr:hypothetical protein [Bacillota bacterium]
MSNQNTLAQANGLVEVIGGLSKAISGISLQEIGKTGQPLLYLIDNIPTTITTVQPMIDALSILINAASSKSSINSPLRRIKSVIDDNSTYVLKQVDDDDVWIQEKSIQLLSLLRTEDIESGIASPAEVFAKQALKENRILALHMINKVHLDNVGNSHIQIGILHLISHIDYELGYPTLQTIARGALSDRDDDVKDYAVRCYEYWNHQDGLRVLKTIHSDTGWLQKYINDVIASLSEDLPEVTSAE